MRVGENPTKFARHNPDLASLQVRPPRPFIASTVVYVPHLTGYYEQGLEILRLNFAAVRANTAQEFDLIVFDNGSCPEVIGLLEEMKQADIIQTVCLSSKNMKKLTAWNHLFSASLHADWIYYFDSDIFHWPGWLEESIRIFDAFPRAGVVSGYPLISPIHEAGPIQEIERDAETTVERGHFIPEDWIRRLGRSLGANADRFVQKKLQTDQIRVTRRGAQAYVGGWHAQFLARGEVIRKVFPRPRDWALNHTDREFDRLVEAAGYLRLCTTMPTVYHLGNVLTPEWEKEAEKYAVAISSRPVRATDAFFRPLAALSRLGPIRRVLLRIYALLFRLIYNT